MTFSDCSSISADEKAHVRSKLLTVIGQEDSQVLTGQPGRPRRSSVPHTLLRQPLRCREAKNMSCNKIDRSGGACPVAWCPSFPATILPGFVVGTLHSMHSHAYLCCDGGIGRAI